VHSPEFKTLKKSFRGIRFYHEIKKDTYEVVTLGTFDLERMQQNATVTTPYNPTEPTQQLIDEYGEDNAKNLMRKKLMARFCRGVYSKGVFIVFAYNMLVSFPSDMDWIVQYTIKWASIANMPETTIPTNFSLLGVRYHRPDHFNTALTEFGFARGMVLSVTHVYDDLIEVWVANEVLKKFKATFDVQVGYDPLQSTGVFKTAIAEKRLLGRIEGVDFIVKQLYAYYLKTYKPDTFENLFVRTKSGGPKGEKTFIVTVHNQAIEIPLSSYQTVKIRAP
jgi:hypothetical protein